MREIKKLIEIYHYKEARELIYKKLEDATEKESFNLKLKLAECYYKDNELNKEYSFEKALKILNDLWNELEHLENFNTEKKECLNLQGAVYKRYFELNNNIKDLQLAISHYEKAWEKYKNEDKGYGAINAANLYDTLAVIIEYEEIKKILHNRANILRKDVIVFLEKLNKKEHWDYHTLITAYIGLEEFEKAKQNIEKIKNNREREKLTTYKTCLNLANVRNFDKNKVANTFELFFNRKEILNLTKTGLALSGGGFRASFFHLGTLAALAEANKLKDIEVISTVSGGSIIGVLYYLKIKKLLETKNDNDINQIDYLILINVLINEFYNGVKNDIRNRLFFIKGFNFKEISKMVNFFNPFSKYNKVKRLAELYQKYFYSKYNLKFLKELKIIPKGTTKFLPRFENFKRNNKVPILVINATNLNNGHNFQFHATKMGESEFQSKFDKNFKVSWLREECEVFNNFLISEAVAASSAVPGIFPAVKVKLKDIELNLVDGGVFENIGLNALFCENCEEIIVSDGGYEMDNLTKLGISYKLKIFSIAKYMHRTIDVLMDVNKDLIYEKLKVNSIFNILANEIKSFSIDCFNTALKKENFYSLFTKIRTDLDSFNEKEAYSIIYLAYMRMKEKLKEKGYNLVEYDYEFKKIKDIWESKKLEQIIKKASKKFFRRL